MIMPLGSQARHYPSRRYIPIVQDVQLEEEPPEQVWQLESQVLQTPLPSTVYSSEEQFWFRYESWRRG
jgi:hypothetical protein